MELIYDTNKERGFIMKKSIKVLIASLVTTCSIAISSVGVMAAQRLDFTLGSTYATFSLSAAGSSISTGALPTSITSVSTVTGHVPGSDSLSSERVSVKITYYEHRNNNPGIRKTGSTALHEESTTVSVSKNADAGYVFTLAESYHKLSVGSYVREETLSEAY